MCEITSKKKQTLKLLGLTKVLYYSKEGKNSLYSVLFDSYLDDCIQLPILREESDQLMYPEKGYQVVRYFNLETISLEYLETG